MQSSVCHTTMRTIAYLVSRAICGTILSVIPLAESIAVFIQKIVPPQKISKMIMPPVANSGNGICSQRIPHSAMLMIEVAANTIKANPRKPDTPPKICLMVNLADCDTVRLKCDPPTIKIADKVGLSRENGQQHRVQQLITGRRAA